MRGLRCSSEGRAVTSRSRLAPDSPLASRPPPGFGAEAFFFTTIGGEGADFGEVLESARGRRENGVARGSRHGHGCAFGHHRHRIAHARRSEQAALLRAQLGKNDDFYQYILDLSPRGKPRYGGSYRVKGGGGTFGETNRDRGSTLAQSALESNSSTGTRTLSSGALELHVRGPATAMRRLRATFMVMPKLAEASGPYTIECLMKDDGDFEIPKAVLEAAPEGFVQAYFFRERRVLVPAGAGPCSRSDASPRTIASRGERGEIAPMCSRRARPQRKKNRRRV